MKDINHIRQGLFCSWVILQGYGLGVLRVKDYFPNMVMWPIKLKGVIRGTQIQVKFSPYGQTGDLAMGLNVKFY